MSDTAIRVENLSKQYRIGGPQARYRTIRESLTEAVQAPFRHLSSVVRGQSSVVSNETIWALKGVSFEVQRGEVVGIIGRNGAGKTTLLKILSRITEPTEGYGEIHGRVGSLLEVGTGFHPELTGRENIYLNGAILGMKRAEINRKFDEIVDFAEIEKFIDTPVKHYSSGMYVRLAFAVAAHLEPEILLVDEVLAVGDAAFQKKCLGKMGDVAKEGRTVLFVSHNMGAVLSLCSRAILLEEGRLQVDEVSDEAISVYLSSLKRSSKIVLRDRLDRGGDQRTRYVDIWFEDSRGRRVTRAVTGQALVVCLEYESALANSRLDFGIGIYDQFGDCLIHSSTRFSHLDDGMLPPRGVVTCTFPRLALPAARYRVNLSIHNRRERVDHVEGAAVLEVESGDFYGTGKVPPTTWSKVLVDYTWSLRGVEDGGEQQ